MTVCSVRKRNWGKNTRILDQGEITANLQLLKIIRVEIVGGCGYLIYYCCKYVFDVNRKKSCWQAAVYNTGEEKVVILLSISLTV